MAEKMPVKITGVVMTYNEEERILDCLTSIKYVSDEIVVVDSFSSDGTEAICNEFGVKFIKHNFEGYIEQRQFAISHAANEYILVLDADEILSTDLITEINTIKNNWEYDAYLFNRLTNYGGKWIRHCGWYPDKKTRLFHRDRIKIHGQNPHDRILVSEGFDSSWVKKDILHYSYTSISNHIEKTNSFSKIAAESAFKQGKKSTLIFHIILKPLYQFIEEYFFRRGFLDGYYGFVICTISSFGKFLKFVKLRELHKSSWR